MSVNEKMTAIADEIRLKTGLSDNVGLGQMALDVASIATKAQDVPDYVKTEAERVAAAVKALQNENTVSFIAITDSHIGTDAQSIASATNAAQAAGIVSGRVPVDFVAILGDTVTGAASDSMETHLANHVRSLRALSYAAPTLRLVGNHDANAYNAASYISAEETHRRMGRYNATATLPASEPERGYCYHDLTEKKLRVICLNTADLKDVAQADAADGHYMSAAQYSWLASTLDMTEKSGWGVIVLSHHPVHWYGYMPNVLTILDAYAAGTSGSITADDTAVSFDFSGKNAAKLIGTFHGHTHNLIHGTAGTSEIPRLGTPNACFSRNNEYGSTAYSEDFRAKYGEETTYSKTASSAKDTAFCVYTIDTVAEVIHATCYGAGYDRTVSYGAVTYYAVINNLASGASTDNAATSVQEGAAYTATLTASGANYEISSVTVTMGGVDVTANVYADGVISITEVTGDIVITATVSGYTNLIDTVGYSDGYRLSTSSGTIKEQSGYVTTGLIDLSEVSLPFVIRARGVNFNYDDNNLCAICSYDADGSFIWATYLGESFSDSSGTFTVEFNDEGDLAVTITESNKTRLKLCGYGSGENLILTVNEEITETDSGDEPVNYTNLIPLSVDTDGSAYNGGTGYKDGYRINSSGVETANSGTSVTGFIPITRGDVVRFSGFTWINGTTQASNHKVVFYSPDKALIYGATLNAWTDTLKAELGAAYDSGGNLVEFTLGFNTSFDASTSNVGFIRLVADTFNGDEVVTINEEIA